MHSRSLRFAYRSLVALLAILARGISSAQVPEQKPAPHLKEEMRMPWTRSHERFVRQWLLLSEIPNATATHAMDHDWLVDQGGEPGIHPADKLTHHLPDGSTIAWRAATSWGDAGDLSNGVGLKRDLVGYAATTITRTEAGKALLCLGSDESIRAWVNGKLVLDHRGARPLTFDEDRVEVNLNAGENLLLLKVDQQTGPWTFCARVLEAGAIPPRVLEIAPSFTEESPAKLVVQTDLNRDHASEDHVTVQAVAAGGKIVAEAEAARGDSVRFDATVWADGAYELRCVTHQPDGLRYATHLPWFKGDAIAAARELVEAGSHADIKTLAGQTTKMLADLTLDRLGKDGLAVTGNPWWAIHSPLMEYAELKLEAKGHPSARARAHGFYRLAWQDEVDGSTQYARAYLPGGYDPAKKWPLVLRLHGFNPPNPEYIRWWGVDSRHIFADSDYGKGEGLIYMEPHGRGNTQFLGLGDRDIMRAIQEAKSHFNVDPDRIYLCGDSMGGWGTWNVGTRHPDLFAAIAPIYGGIDYHSFLTEEQLAALTPLNRFFDDKGTSLTLADGLLNMPIMVLHGDADHSVNVDWSRYNVRMLQRWGYDIRYLELPGYGHEDLSRFPFLFSWFLEHRRATAPRHVRLRSAELQNASAYWASVDVADRSDRFMVIDAEITGANTIRLDSQNILALTLSPAASLIDPKKPINVVWNGEARSVSMKNGRIALRATGFTAPEQAKDSIVAGPIGDILNVPFAIVTGTASTDTAMNDACRQKAETMATLWRTWQHVTPRMFKDSELSDTDAARYSLILIGGADCNLVTRKLADKLPLKISRDQIAIGGHVFAVTEATVQMIRPNPLNPQHYVLIIAGSTTDAFKLWNPNNLRGAECDFVIDDNRVPNVGQEVGPSDLWIAGGWFDRGWSVDESLIYPGNSEQRAKSCVLQGPLESSVLDAYVGKFETTPGNLVSVQRTDRQLSLQVGEQAVTELIPAGADRFYLGDGAFLIFERDPAGRVVSFKHSQNGRDNAGKRVE